MFFGGGGGFPFPEGFEEEMRGGGRKRKDINTTEYYETLGVSKDASQDEIRKAYKKLAVRHHPDKGGDETKFKEITEAANVLMDEQKRELYDRHGKDGVEGGGGEGGMEDVLSAMFGGGGRRQERRQQVAPIQRKVQVALEDFYCGRSFSIEVERKRMCSDCKGSGAKNPNADTTCHECNGHGVQIVRRSIGPGFTQQMQVRCQKCKGTGSSVSKKDMCKKCDGEKLMTETKELTVEIQKGMSHGEKIIFREEGHLVPDIDAGDVVVILLMKDHDKFERKENDLLFDMEISLIEALAPRTLALKHMDGRVLHVHRPEGHIISPGEVVKIAEEGMPKKENPMIKGNLFVRFKVAFPSSLPEDVVTSVVSSLSDYSELKASVEDSDSKMNGDEEPWDVMLDPVGMEEFGRKSNRHRQAYDEGQDSEDESGGQGGGVQCQQM